MEIENLFIPATNPFATGYYAGDPEIQRHFHYNYQEQKCYSHRLKDLAGRTFMRERLADHISAYMQPFPSSEKVAQSIAKLRQENSVVVIGGQQAGILTGPLYTIHKVISIIALAKEKELELGVPVVPVFWIAGEDHDYPEVNHVYMPNEGQMQKCHYPDKVFEKRMVTECLINRDVCLDWTESLIGTLGETRFTNDLLELTEEAISKSRTFVDYFAYLIMALFKEHGLLIVDSGDLQLRQLEKEIFLQQIEDNVQIHAALLAQQKEIQMQGLKNTIELTKATANLFFYDEKYHERILLQYDEGTKIFTGKNGSISFTMEELSQIAREQPEKLSNNVVTRPLTQELLFPTLAFIAGPGEIAYWAELKKVFERFQMNMPIIVPRINITLLERETESELDDLGLNLHEVLQSGVGSQKDDFLSSVKDKGFATLFSRTKEQLQENYRFIAQRTKEEYNGLLPLLNKNEALIMREIEFMEEKIEESLRMKYEHRLKKYDRVENSLRPSGGPQERVWNVFYFLNKYGLNLVNELCGLPFRFDGNHKVVKL